MTNNGRRQTSEYKIKSGKIDFAGSAPYGGDQTFSPERREESGTKKQEENI